MKLIIFAFILSLTIHILLFSPLSKKKEEPKLSPSTSKYVQKSSVQYVTLLPKTNSTSKIVKKVEETKAKENKIIQKPKVYKKVEKKNIKPQKRKKLVNKPKIIIPKPIKKMEVRPNFTKKVPIKPQKKRKTIPKKSLENFLLVDPVPLDKRLLDDITRSYINLYGEEYNSFTKVQKVFIQSTIRRIVEITKKYYRFPYLAERNNENGYNEIKFTLYPNGDISGLEVTKKSNYSYYDKSIIETIEFAYKDYPRPKMPTTIRIYINYKVR